jgi:hypothetical protein
VEAQRGSVPSDLWGGDHHFRDYCSAWGERFREQVVAPMPCLAVMAVFSALRSR